MKRIYHTWDKWECYPAGFYSQKPPKGMSKEDCEDKYKSFLLDDAMFSASLFSVVTTWNNSCEHYLTNEKMNRIAWLGQAAMCYYSGIPSTFRGGFNLLTEEEQENANKVALKYLNVWLKSKGEKEVSIDQAIGKFKANLY